MIEQHVERGVAGALSLQLDIAIATMCVQDSEKLGVFQLWKNVL